MLMNIIVPVVGVRAASESESVLSRLKNLYLLVACGSALYIFPVGKSLNQKTNQFRNYFTSEISRTKYHLRICISLYIYSRVQFSISHY